MTLTSHRVFALFSGQKQGSSLAALARKLLVEQDRSWTQLAEGYASLRSVKTRELACDGFTVTLQLNPKRIVSTAADTSSTTILRRACFLCVENLPDIQKGILYRDEFLLLCNPAPIFSHHFTISNTQHVAQAIEPFVGMLLDLTKDLSPDFTVFYNGPRCGASAPDHVHFQAGPARAIPVEWEVEARKKLAHQGKNVSLSTVPKYGRQVFVLESDSRNNLESYFKKLVDVWKKVLKIDEEPMMNVICSFSNDGQNKGWRMIVFPRAKHRPDVYFKEEDQRILVSPAAVDLGGLVITPVEKDFERLDAPTIEGIFREVSLDAGRVEEILAGMNA